MEKSKFDIIVLGGGPGGYPAAIRAAQRGKKVALIEAKEVGGTCLNRGCIPSKALIAGSDIVSRLHEAEQFGISIKGYEVNFARLAAHKDRIVAKMRGGLEGLIAANKITLIRGFGEFVGPKEIKVKGQETTILQADKIIIATGSEPRNIRAFAFDYTKIHDSTSLLDLQALPKSIAIVGGGVIGCEFASLYSTLGVEVIILEMLPRIIATEIPEISDALTKALTKKGVKVLTGVAVQAIEKTPEGIRVLLADGQKISAEISLIAVGRSLNTYQIGLEKVGISMLENGIIPVNDKMETEVPGIYAVGDIASKWWLAHVASHQGLVAADNACGIESHMHYNAIPSIIFTHPEIGSVGFSLEEAKKRGYKARVSAFPFQALGKSQAALQAEGFAQIVIDEKTGQILGAQVIGFEAATLVAEMGLAITNELTVECLAETIHGHPTIAEAWLESALIAEGLPLHYPPKKSS